MLKLIKYGLLGLIGLFIVFGAGITLYFTVNDANDFKPVIESQAKKQAGINLRINGELAWSLFPLGITINKLELFDQHRNLFASSRLITASMDLMSLLRAAPEVSHIVIDGLTLELVKKQGQPANWTAILPAETADSKPETATPKKQDKPSAEKSDQSISFLVQSFKLENSSLHYYSEPDEIDISLANIQLVVSDITLTQDFPLTLQFDLANKKPEARVNTRMSGLVSLSKDLTTFTLKNFSSNYSINSSVLGKQTSQASLSAEVTANKETETIDIQQINLGFEHLALTGQMNIQEYSKDARISGQIALAEFSPRQLLTHLDIPLPEMNNTRSLSKLALNSQFTVHQQKISASGLTFKLDNSEWKGGLVYLLPNQDLTLKLKGDQINLDDYLPPEVGNQITASASPASANQEDTQNTPAHIESALLPLDTLRALKLDIQLEQQSLSIKKLESTALKTRVTAKQGLIKLEQLSGDFYNGRYEIQATLDARKSQPLWSSSQRLSGIEIEPIATKLSELEYIVAGTLNLTATENSKGNTLVSLMDNATANSEFEITQGKLKGISLNTMACEGLALINRETINTETWPDETPFNELKGHASLKAQQIESTLNINTSGLKLTGNGLVDLIKKEVDYQAGVQIIGAVDQHACRVNEKLKDIIIPIRCEGHLDTPPAKLCGLHGKQLTKEIERAAIKEGKRKAQKEVDRALDKYLDKEDEGSKQLKNLLKKWL